MNKDAKIYIAGHRGLVGSAILKKLKADGFSNFVLKTHSELDLTDANAVASFFAEEKPEYVFLAAAKVGGIVANNTYRADFIYANLMIQNNVVHHSYVNNVKKLLFLGSTCIYPKECPQPMKEDYLLTDTLEYTNEPYAIAKIAGIKLCESYNLQYGTNFISVMPTNLYGPNDNFDLEKSHVLPALIRKMHLGKGLEAKDWDNVRKDLNERPIEGVDGNASESDIYSILEKYGIKKADNGISVEIWGSGKPMREFLWSEDMADACIFIMKSRDFEDTYAAGEKEIRNTHINIGTGKDLSIRELAESIKDMVGFGGSLNFNADKPDGTMKKLTDVSKLHGLGWKHSIDLQEGIEKMYSWYRSE
ncbi:GDP-L-fucose synthase [Zobellia roscoffensis]|uniref:GDP-L-fucose synthase family protein n=1 Tax=Zobellia roscoffensis TaxID=2779508 RepID=UPI00188BD593|nr:GDP-L-fucose synthase [Zobellia roscoffensis]